MLSRRQFVTSTLAAGVAPASQIAIAQPAQRTIVDAQVHLWKAEVRGLEMGPRHEAADAGAIHNRETRAVDR